MKIIALEEHYCTAEIKAAWDNLPAEFEDASLKLFNRGETERRLEDLGENRLRHMDEMGVDVQVISLTTPATQALGAAESVELSKAANDLASKAVKANPHRLEAFATLPTPDPKAAAKELERCVDMLGMKGAMLTGRTRNASLNAPQFLPIFETAARLRVPLYLHPQIPVKAVRDVYYTGFGEDLDTMFATGGWGWHAESGIQALRLILAGVFDKFPQMQMILGHWGEIIMLYLERIGPALDMGAKGKLDRTIECYLKENFYVTPSGIFSDRYLRNAIEIMGADRVMFAVDYPFQHVRDARAFLTAANIPEEDKAKIAHGNWERLTLRGGGAF